MICFLNTNRTDGHEWASSCALAVNLHRGDSFTQNSQTYAEACIAIARMRLRRKAHRSQLTSHCSQLTAQSLYFLEKRQK